MEENNLIVKKEEQAYSFAEELANAISHGIGTILAIAGNVVGIVISTYTGSALAVVSMSIYGAMLIILYTMSTLYHSLTNPKAKRVFKVLDHASVYLLIAGTYTPILLVGIGGVLGWTMFGIVWGIAIISITFSSISLEKFKKLNIFFSLLLGWIIIFIAKPFTQLVDIHAINLIIAGGIGYTIGVIFYKMKKVRFTHAIWHLFVLGASILHFFAIVLYIL